MLFIICIKVEPRRSRAMPSHQQQGAAEPQPGGSGLQQGGAVAQHHPVAGPSTSSGGAWLHQHQGTHVNKIYKQGREIL